MGFGDVILSLYYTYIYIHTYISGSPSLSFSVSICNVLKYLHISVCCGHIACHFKCSQHLSLPIWLIMHTWEGSSLEMLLSTDEPPRLDPNRRAQSPSTVEWGLFSLVRHLRRHQKGCWLQGSELWNVVMVGGSGIFWAQVCVCG